MLVGEVLRGIEQKRVIQVRKAERLTQQMVDIIQADESILVGLASIKDFDAYTFSHSVNVCVLSLLIGRPPASLQERHRAPRDRRAPPRHRQDVRPAVDTQQTVETRGQGVGPDEVPHLLRSQGALEGEVAARGGRRSLRRAPAPRPLQRRRVPVEARRRGTFICSRGSSPSPTTTTR